MDADELCDRDLETMSWEVADDYLTESKDVEITATMRKIELTLDETVFEPGSSEYRKARKRRQNRESAARTRMLKRSAVQELHTRVDMLSKTNAILRRENREIKAQNRALKKEVARRVKAELGLAKMGKTQKDSAEKSVCANSTQKVGGS